MVICFESNHLAIHNQSEKKLEDFLIFELKLKYWILKNFNTISAFSDELGISQTNISRYLNGTRKPGYRFFKKIKKMGCDLNWLFEDEPKESKSLFKKIKDNNSLLLIFISSFIGNSCLTEFIIIF